MTQVYFKVHDNPSEKTIIFEVVNFSEPIPPEQQDLVLNIESALETIRTLYRQDHTQITKNYDRLLQIARLGLTGNPPKTELAAKILEQFKVHITNKEGGIVKSAYLRELGTKAIRFGLPALLTGIVINYFICCEKTSPLCLNYVYTAALLVLWAGAMLGVWLSQTISKTHIGFDDLALMDKDRLEPTFRLLFTGLLAAVIAMMLDSRLIEISLGEIKSSQVLNGNRHILTFLIGVILGLNEKILGSTLTSKVQNIFSSSSNTTQPQPATDGTQSEQQPPETPGEEEAKNPQK